MARLLTRPCPRDASTPIALPALPAPRCLSKSQAAAYLGIGVTLLTALGVPSIRLGRRCLYDRLDLDAWLEDYKQRGRARKDETLWPKKQASIEDRILGTGGLQRRSQTAKEYAKALGLKSGKTQKPCSPS